MTGPKALLVPFPSQIARRQRRISMDTLKDTNAASAATHSSSRERKTSRETALAASHCGITIRRKRSFVLQPCTDVLPSVRSSSDRPPEDDITNEDDLFYEMSLSSPDLEDLDVNQAQMQTRLLSSADEDTLASSREHDEERPQVAVEMMAISDLQTVVFKNKLVDTILGAQDFRASIRPEHRHIEIWDEKEDLYVLPSEFHLTYIESEMFDVMIDTPNICLLSIQFYTVHPNPRNRPATHLYSITFTGHELNATKVAQDRVIQIDPLWISATINEDRGWYFNFWTPIPLSLFLNAETRTFQFFAQVAFGPSAKRGILSARGDLTISHLQKYRDML